MAQEEQQIKFQYYSNDATKPNPLGYVEIDDFLNAIRNPKDKVKEILKKIQVEEDATKKANLKTHLYGFTPSATFENRRAYDNIINFTGLAVLDFDKISNADDFKHYLFDTYKFIIASWLSPSLKGIKALVKIPVVKTIKEFKSYFYGLAYEMEVYNGFDPTTQNASLLLFIGWDKDILIRKDYSTWKGKGKKINSFDDSPTIKKPNFVSTHKQKQWVINWITDKINGITDTGHPVVRDNCISLGGYVASGYISFPEAQGLVHYLISINGYLKKGTNGYKKTATSAINEGMKKPIIFGNNEKI